MNLNRLCRLPTVEKMLKINLSSFACVSPQSLIKPKVSPTIFHVLKESNCGIDIPNCTEMLHMIKSKNEDSLNAGDCDYITITDDDNFRARLIMPYLLEERDFSDLFKEAIATGCTNIVSIVHVLQYHNEKLKNMALAMVKHIDDVDESVRESNTVDSLDPFLQKYATASWNAHESMWNTVFMAKQFIMYRLQHEKEVKRFESAIIEFRNKQLKWIEEEIKNEEARDKFNAEKLFSGTENKGAAMYEKMAESNITLCTSFMREVTKKVKDQMKKIESRDKKYIAQINELKLELEYQKSVKPVTVKRATVATQTTPTTTVKSIATQVKPTTRSTYSDVANVAVAPVDTARATDAESAARECLLFAEETCRDVLLKFRPELPAPRIVRRRWGSIGVVRRRTNFDMANFEEIEVV